MAQSIVNDAPSAPRDLSHHFSKASQHRSFNNMKAFYKYFMIPGIGNLAGGLPNVSFFPFDTLEAQVAKPDRYEPSPNGPAQIGASTTGASSAEATSTPVAASHITVPKIADEADLAKRVDLATALQYGTAQGYPPLKSFIRQFAREQLHPNTPYATGPEVVLTVGSTDGFNKVVEMIVDPWIPERDPAETRPHMLCEVFVYPAVLNQTKHKGVRPVTVEIDGEGMLAEGTGGLRDVLENWDPRNGRRPHFMYTVTMGHNPTSGVLSLERRKALYAICCEYDVLIVEDDPYWYLQFPSAAQAEAESRGHPRPEIDAPPAPTKSSGYEFLDSLVQSYLSIDVEGRVLRLDTFSKTIAPGCRLGWITAQPAFIAMLERVTETLTQQPSGFVQSMVAELIMGRQPEPATASFFSLAPRAQPTFTGWDTSGWVRWLAGLRGTYERRMNRMCAILDKHAFQLKQSTPASASDADWGVVTKTRLLSFDWARGGMFLWVRVHLENHPLWQARGDKLPLLDGPALATALFIFLIHRPYLVIPAPGRMFAADDAVAAARAWSYIRLCFAAEDEARIDPLSERVGEGVQKFWRIKSVKEMEGLISEFGAEGVNSQDAENVGYFDIGC